MEKKSESWCSWFVSKIKSCFCPRKKTYLETIPACQTSKIMDFLDDRDMMALSFVNTTLELKTKYYRTMKFEKENLLDCILTIWALEKDIPGVGKRFAENCIDYKTGGEFNVYDYNVRVRTLRDFAEYFVKSKDNNQYNQLIKELSDKYKEYHSCYESKIIEADINYVENLVSICCNKSCKDLWLERLRETKKHKFHDYKKQINNYTKTTGESYESIYNQLTNKPNPKKPEREKYIKAYEELKKEEGGCSIF